jgi:hypothetical protein
MNAITGDRYTGEWYQGMKHGTGIWDRKNAKVEVIGIKFGKGTRKFFDYL